MKSKILLLYLVFLVSCSPDFEYTVNIFNNNEINELNKVVNFFNNSICKSENLDTTDILECYNQYLKRMSKATSLEEISTCISYQKQINLMQELKSETFNQIWEHQKIWNKTSDTIWIYSLKHESKYVDFLEELGKKNPKINQYYKRLKTSNDLTPSMIVDVLHNYNQYDTKDYNIRIFLAIHYLTLNEALKIYEN